MGAMRHALFAVLLAVLSSCSDDTACVRDPSTGGEVPSDPTGGPIPAMASCCDVPASSMCETHPYGRAPYCDGIEEPQTVENCQALTTANPGLCASEYVACRDAIRAAACDVCPPECADIIGAC